MPFYRPMAIAKPAELSALGMIDGEYLDVFEPVLLIPPRVWNFDEDEFSKSMNEHYAPFPDALARAVSSWRSFIDVSLLDAEEEIDGVHPLAWIINETRKRNLDTVPLAYATSSASLIASINDIHRQHATGLALRLEPDEWTSIDPGAAERLLAGLEFDSTQIDLFLDVNDQHGPLVLRSLLTEIEHLLEAFEFRSITLTGSSFPDLNGVGRGLTEFERTEWNLYGSLVDALAEDIDVAFSDSVIQRADQVDLGVDPRVLSLSATFRYTTADLWLVAKGGLFKAPGGKSEGGRAMLPALKTLSAHQLYSTPIRTEAEGWVEQVLGGDVSGGSPQTWRKWGTLRHLRVTLHQLAN